MVSSFLVYDAVVCLLLTLCVPPAVDTDANNELITDGGFVQPLTSTEIEALKKSGANATVHTCFLSTSFCPDYV